MSLAFHVYHPGAKAIFDVTSTLITGEKDAFLVDAQFQKQYAEELVQLIKDRAAGDLHFPFRPGLLLRPGCTG